MGLNYVVLMGEVINSPEKKHTPDGQAVASFNMTFSSSYEESKDSKSGVIKVSALKKLADKCMQEVSNGSTVVVEGRLYTKNIENRQGQRQKIPYIHASNLELVKNKEMYISTPKFFSEPSTETTTTSQIDDEEIPF